MSNHHGGNSASSGSVPLVPPAVRTTRKGWKDARLWAGVALVTLSVVAGSRLFAAADDTVPVWVATETLHADMPVDPSAFEQTRVHLDAAEAERYLRVAEGRPSGVVLREVGAGELVPVAALGKEPTEKLTTVSVELPRAQVPGEVGPGSRVDVWVLPSTGVTGRAEKTRRLLRGVLVLEAPSGDSLTGESTRQLVLGVAAQTSDADLTALVEAAGAARVMVSGESAS